MPVDAFRVPDLWLKRALIYSLLPKGQKTFRLNGETLIRCMRGDEGSVFMLNKLIAGDVMAGVRTDLFYFAATMEYLLVHGPQAPFNREKIEQFTQERGGDLLLETPMLGTYSALASAALELLRQQAHWTEASEVEARIALGRTIRQQVQERIKRATSISSPLRLLWGPQRNWALHAEALDRILRQPAKEIPEIPEKNFVQVVLPPPPTDQWVFGFEMRTDDAAATMPWSESGGWFSPLFQREGEAIALLPEYVEERLNTKAEVEGRFWMQIVGVPAKHGENGMPELPVELAQLKDNCPNDWPTGYAEAMAAITYIDRIRDKHQRAKRRAERHRKSRFGSKTKVKIPSLPRLYHAEYTVVRRDSQRIAS